jgi:hypothetical protein
MVRVVVRFDERGNPDFLSDGGDVELIVIDERAPADRVYRHQSHAVKNGVIDELIGEDRIGHAKDDKQLSCEGLVKALGGQVH